MLSIQFVAYRAGPGLCIHLHGIPRTTKWRRIAEAARVQQLIPQLIDITNSDFKTPLQQRHLLRRGGVFYPEGMQNLALTFLDGRHPEYGWGAIETHAVMLNAAELLQGPFWRRPGVTRT